MVSCWAWSVQAPYNFSAMFESARIIYLLSLVGTSFLTSLAARISSVAVKGEVRVRLIDEDE
jgi:hypothetical protein